MAGALGWPPEALRRATLAEIYACWIGHARAQGWIRDEPLAMTRARLREMMAEYPDG
jgi:hypothetical protein